MGPKLRSRFSVHDSKEVLYVFVAQVFPDLERFKTHRKTDKKAEFANY